MLLRHLACLLILLIATQSAIAVADAHKLHQSGFEHLKFDHSHSPFDNTDYSIAKQLSDLPSQSSDDCHRSSDDLRDVFRDPVEASSLCWRCKDHI